MRGSMRWDCLIQSLSILNQNKAQKNPSRYCRDFLILIF
jgi:hypothetical protein